MFNPLEIPGLPEEPQYLSHNSAWIYHLPMVPVFMHLLQPNTFVELGTFRGDSYMGFCQTVVRQQLSTRCTAVDTWEGDEHAGRYTTAVYNDLKAQHDPKYAGFSRLFKALFDVAVKDFADGAIDLLHIDGLHTYEAVKHDYDTWLPKMSDRGVILFHDTAIRDRGFGVFQLWEEISKERPSFNVPYGCGLGILAVGEKVPAGFVEFLADLNAHADRILPLFIALGRRNELARISMTLTHGIHDCQSMINQWRGGTGQAIRNKAPDIARAIADPIGFAKLLSHDVAATVTDAVNLLTEITELRKFKAAHQQA
jgi:hypothetical protein